MNPDDPTVDTTTPTDSDVEGHLYLPPDERPGARPRPGEGRLEDGSIDEAQDSAS